MVATSDWEIGAIYAYDIIHNGKQNLENYRHHTKESLLEILSQYNLSNNGKKPMSDTALKGMTTLQLKTLLAAIHRTNNLVDITSVHASALPDADVLTYSFPCQDLSVARHWHHNTGGIDRSAHNRSSLLWQIERLLHEYVGIGKELPRFLLMENVSAILNRKNITNFHEWCSVLEGLGYVNQVYTLDARDFGVPQSRRRTYMLSVRADTPKQKEDVELYFLSHNLEDISLPNDKIRPIGDYLRLDYSNEVYRKEAIESTPNFTPSRERIFNNSRKLATDSTPNNQIVAGTITTKQDRDPNSGIVVYDKEVLTESNTRYRNLTPRECFLLMGFQESDFDALMENNKEVRQGVNLLNNSELIKLAGNSIVVPVLEEIFKQVEDIQQIV
ncbi:DNA (cytosine-5-)-methyltransferase [Lactobacillus amylovorus]|uniref:DNA (cytosine-5-)-methyltransferase n=1 Tax=Lactobacillus amylovorus TaxID=1604 RepID=UPI002FD9DBA6